MSQERMELSKRLGAALKPLNDIAVLQAKQGMVNEKISINADKRWKRFGGVWKVIEGTFLGIVAIGGFIQLTMGKDFIVANGDTVSLAVGAVSFVGTLLTLPIISGIINKNIDRKNKELIQQREEMDEQIHMIRVQYHIALSNIPAKYCNFYTVSFMKKCVDNGRADTMKEVINLYEEDKYRQGVNENQRSIMAQQQEIAELAGQAAQEARNASWMATAAMISGNEFRR